jgi:hypothetical protein
MRSETAKTLKNHAGRSRNLLKTGKTCEAVSEQELSSFVSLNKMQNEETRKEKK